MQTPPEHDKREPIIECKMNLMHQLWYMRTNEDDRV